jgi:hypothetical protein
MSDFLKTLKMREKLGIAGEDADRISDLLAAKYFVV